MEYRTVDISTVEGMDEVERLLRAGWETYRAGLFYAYLRRRNA